MIINQGATGVLDVEWRTYAGGPLAAVTGVQITITPLAGGAAVIGPTATGVTTPATGINAYSWTVSGALAAGDYLALWTGTDGQADAVSATEIITVGSGSALAIGDPYATLAELKDWLGIRDADTTKDVRLASRLASATDDINRWTHRQFGRAEVATSRTFRPGRSGLDTHDFWTLDDLVIVPYLGTTPGTAWDLTQLQFEPLDGIVDQMPGWPYRRICSNYGDHPLATALFYGAGTVQVTAKWGWENCPTNVTTACLLLAAQDNKSSDAAFGVVGFGDYAMRIKSNPMAEEKLRPYLIDEYQVAS
jgi:hypothetical protein